MPVNIRPAEIADLPRLLELYQELSGSLYPDQPSPSYETHLAKFREIEARSDITIFVAEVEGQLIGTFTLLVAPNLGHGCMPWAVLENMVVTEQQRSRGVGTKMMAIALEKVREAGCYKVSLTSNLVRRNAHRFYERLGWRKSHFGYTLETDSSPIPLPSEERSL